MGRSVLIKMLALFFVFAFLAALAGCGSSSTTPSNFPTPAGVTLTPGSAISIDLGAVQTFTSSAHDASSPPRILTVPIEFHSSNTAVVTIANNGLACAGTWNSLTNPQICTPGGSGTAQITASSAGVSSPPTTVYVHQHIDSVSVSAVNPPATSCLSKGGIETFAAKAFSHGADITSSVGQFTWQSSNGQVVTVSNTVQGLTLDQAEATASLPGLTQIFASISGVNSIPVPFTTCPVQTITLAVTGGTTTSYNVTQGTSKTITPTVIDSLGTTITGVPLTWCSSHPTVSSTGSTNCTSSTSEPFSVSNPKAGGATITASCTPPACNIGFNPALPVYPTGVITSVVTPTSGTTSSGTVYVSSTACATTTNCAGTAVVPIAYSTTDTVGAPVGLPANPNSILFGPQGTAFFLGTDLGLQGTKGVMRVDVSGAGPSVSEFTSVTGRALATSPAGAKVIFSDTIQVPNQVFVFDNTSNTSQAFQITGATAAAFSPDGLKAFIVAGNNLYVYSTLNALQTIPMGFSGSAVSFLPEGAFGYIVGPSQVTVRRTCDNGVALSPPPGSVTQVIPLPGTPTIIRPVPDATQILALDPPQYRCYRGGGHAKWLRAEYDHG